MTLEQSPNVHVKLWRIHSVEKILCRKAYQYILQFQNTKVEFRFTKVRFCKCEIYDLEKIRIDPTPKRKFCLLDKLTKNYERHIWVYWPFPPSSLIVE